MLCYASLCGGGACVERNMTMCNSPYIELEVDSLLSGHVDGRSNDESPGRRKLNHWNYTTHALIRNLTLLTFLSFFPSAKKKNNSNNNRKKLAATADRHARVLQSTIASRVYSLPLDKLPLSTSMTWKTCPAWLPKTGAFFNINSVSFSVVHTILHLQQQ